MLEKLLFLLILFFLFLYFMRALLLAGYANILLSNDKKRTLRKDFWQNLIKLKPLVQKSLPLRNIEFRIYSRFMLKSELYYYALWIILIIALLLSAKIYLDF